MIYGPYLKDARVSKGLSVEYVSDTIDISQATLLRMESGEDVNLAPHKLSQLLKLLTIEEPQGR